MQRDRELIDMQMRKWHLNKTLQSGGSTCMEEKEVDVVALGIDILVYPKISSTTRMPISIVLRWLSRKISFCRENFFIIDSTPFQMKELQKQLNIFSQTRVASSEKSSSYGVVHMEKRVVLLILKWINVSIPKVKTCFFFSQDTWH